MKDEIIVLFITDGFSFIKHAKFVKEQFLRNNFKSLLYTAIIVK